MNKFKENELVNKALLPELVVVDINIYHWYIGD